VGISIFSVANKEAWHMFCSRCISHTNVEQQPDGECPKERINTLPQQMVSLFYKVTILCIWVSGVGLQPIDFWNHELESRGFLCLLSDVHVAASATGWSLVRRSRTECIRLILCEIETLKMRRSKPTLGWCTTERKSFPSNASSRTTGQQIASPL
jgi:hypothetical protein